MQNIIDFFNLVNILTVFGIAFTIFFLLFMRGAGKLNAEYDELMNRALGNDEMSREEYADKKAEAVKGWFEDE